MHHTLTDTGIEMNSDQYGAAVARHPDDIAVRKPAGLGIFGMDIQASRALDLPDPCEIAELGMDALAGFAREQLERVIARARRLMSFFERLVVR
jgi:hypothetical protein